MNWTARRFTSCCPKSGTTSIRWAVWIINSEGLIFLTNDGQFALRLTHPRYGVRKKYVATVEGRVEPEMLGKFTQGVFHEGEKLKAEKGAAGFGHQIAERGGTGIGRGQKPRSAAAV